MLGSIIGDVIGSVYEYHNVKREDFPLFKPSTSFTDDTVMTAAVADAILSRPEDADEETIVDLYAAKLREWGRRYPDADYGGAFRAWLRDKLAGPYNSFGNGAAMRVGPVGFAFGTLEETLREAGWSAAVTHNHPEGIRGARATAAAIYLARTGESMNGIRAFIEDKFGYDLGRSMEEIRDGYHYDVTCQGTVPEAITAFLASCDFEDALRKAISLGGDSDTLASITCGIAQAYYKEIPEKIATRVITLLTPDLRLVLGRFEERYGAWR